MTPEDVQAEMAAQMGVPDESQDAPRFGHSTIELPLDQAEYIAAAMGFARGHGFPMFRAWREGR